jgi:agmatinase
VTRQRYGPPDAMAYPRFEGIRTFMRLPHVTKLDGVDLAVIGVPFDTGGTYRVGARFGPSGIRQESMLLRPYNPELDVDVFERLSVVDYGDLPVTPGYLPESHAQIQEGAASVLATATLPLFLGGDHSVSLPILRAVAERHGPVGLVHVDAHSDLWEGYFGGKDTHGTPFRRAVEEGLLDPARTIQIGIRGPLNDLDLWSFSHESGMRVIYMDELYRMGIDAAVAEARRIATGPVYVSFDIDALDPAFAPGTGTPEVGGLTTLEAQILLRGLRGLDIMGGDVVETSPPFDPSGTTSLVAANLLFELLCVTAEAVAARRGAGEGN